jgi:transcription elongation factor SPT6
MSTANLFDLDAELGSEEDEDFEGEAEDSRPRKQKAPGVIDDSSDEEEDDDEEAEREVRPTTLHQETHLTNKRGRFAKDSS